MQPVLNLKDSRGRDYPIPTGGSKYGLPISASLVENTNRLKIHPIGGVMELWNQFQCLNSLINRWKVLFGAVHHIYSEGT